MGAGELARRSIPDGRSAKAPLLERMARRTIEINRVSQTKGGADMSTVDSLLDQALGLSPEERADLAHRLLCTLSDWDESLSNEEAAWAEEIRARSDALARGELVSSDWRESLARVRQRMLERRSP